MNAEKKPNMPWWQPGLVLFLKLSSWVVAPVLVGILAGKWLDKKYHTAPWLFLLSVGMAFAISMIAIVVTGMREMKKIEKENKKK